MVDYYRQGRSCSIVAAASNGGSANVSLPIGAPRSPRTTTTLNSFINFDSSTFLLHTNAKQYLPLPRSVFPTLKAMSQTVVLKVGMSCQGCVGAVKRVLGKMEGVESYDIDLEQQKVTVKGNVQPDAVLQTVSKTGKKTAFWEAEAPAEAEAEAEAEAKPAEAPAEAEGEAKPTEAVAAA
ncbi:hypothetical protein V6N12_062202 [Hibiscus sabdariffa]|uniref:HMA domain-containing protein n=1 Tax=Hibiscus sabdariffa TaxID=183260 RepID=A0ABR2F8E5_9ROSI